MFDKCVVTCYITISWEFSVVLFLQRSHSYVKYLASYVKFFYSEAIVM